jgi:periplasmic divalent cation tolerance protein
MIPLLVLTNLPDLPSAEAMATTLIEQHLAACVNIMAPCRSIYRWQASVTTTNEVPLLIKTTEARFPALQAAIHAAHPYELPEVIAIPITRGLPGYLAWMAAETQPVC